MRLPGELSSGVAWNDFEAELAPLWKRAHAGDEAAYREALEAIAARLRGYFARRLSSVPHEVEDLVQETFWRCTCGAQPTTLRSR